MYYNKLYGLEHLRKALHGTAGVSVLPWRVYRKPEEFQPGHFPGAKRVLLRTNLEGNMNRGAWGNLPREEATPREAREVMAQLSRKWVEKLLTDSSGIWLRGTEKPRSLHFIVHSVEPRANYPIACIVERQLGISSRWFFNVKTLSRGNKVWRTAAITDSEDSQSADDLETLKKALHKLKTNLNKRQVNTLANRIVRACTAIEKHFKKQGVDLEETVLETSLAVNKREPTKPEFYDLLLKPETLTGLTTAGRPIEIDASVMD
ncbi:MAG: hypothetical protein V1722_04260 [Candidatus Micrarchaeota archaeon]